MGFIQPLGDAAGRMSRVAGPEPGQGEGDDDLFAGVDTRLAAIADLLPTDLALRREIRALLERVAEIATAARRGLTASDPGGATEHLLEILRLLQDCRDQLSDSEAGGVRHVRELLDEKLAIAREATAKAAQVLADAVTDRETVVPEGSLEVR